jgi:hypothetical protein
MNPNAPTTAIELAKVTFHFFPSEVSFDSFFISSIALGAPFLYLSAGRQKKYVAIFQQQNLAFVAGLAVRTMDGRGDIFVVFPVVNHKVFI